MKHLLQECIDYILETESEDYFIWCDENGYDQNDFKENSNCHIFATANLAHDFLNKKEQK